MSPDEVAACIAAHVPRNGARQMVALAGPPASGKTTVADRLVAHLNAAGRSAVVLPMDGFHLDNGLLDGRGLRARKGAPETFDLGGFDALVARAKVTGEAVFVPTFDRTRDIAIAGGAEIPASCDVVVVEGNYLLFDEPGWRDLRRHWDLAVFFDMDPGVLETRLVDRWLTHGLSPQDAQARARTNDMANARRTLGARCEADLTLCG